MATSAPNAAPALVPMIGGRERVPKDALHERARQREAGTDERPEHHPGRPAGPHDHDVVLSEIGAIDQPELVAEDPEHHGGVQVRGTDEDPGDARAREQEQAASDQSAEPPPPLGCGRHGAGSSPYSGPTSSAASCAAW